MSEGKSMKSLVTRDSKGRFVSPPKTIEVRDRKGRYRRLQINLRETSIQYFGRSSNKKIGSIPSQWIGASREESLATCTICPLAHNKTCYSQYGSPSIAHSQIRKADARGKDYSYNHALNQRLPRARYVRMGSIGDPGSIAPDVYIKHEEKARSLGLGVLSYTHQWFLDHARFLRNRAMASCDTWKDVWHALANGWRVAFHVDKNAKVFAGKSISESPKGTVHGKRYALCPAQWKDFVPGKEKKNIQCNECGLCDVKKNHNIDIIVFAEHGRQMKFWKKRGEKLTKE